MDLTAHKPKKRLNRYWTALVIIVCITMLTSVTFAWFTYKANKEVHFTVGQVTLNVDYCPATVNGFLADGECFNDEDSIDAGITIEQDVGALVCNKPLISHYKFKNYDVDGMGTTVACYVRVFFEYSAVGNDSADLIEKLNSVTLDVYDDPNAPYAWSYRVVKAEDEVEGVGYYYLVDAKDQNNMYKVESSATTDYYFMQNARFPNVEILNHLLATKVSYKIKIEAIQASHLSINGSDVSQVGDVGLIMNDVFKENAGS